MKKHFLLSLMVLVLLSAYKPSFAQVTIEADTVWYYGFVIDNTIQSKYCHFSNQTNGPIAITWQKGSQQQYPDNKWKLFSICDPEQCFLDANPHTFSIPANTTEKIGVSMRSQTGAANGTAYATLTTNYGEVVFAFTTASAPTTNINNSIYPAFINIYPNPCQDKVIFNFKTTNIVYIAIIEVGGKTVQETEVNAFGNELFQYQTANLPQGTYKILMYDEHHQLVNISTLAKQ